MDSELSSDTTLMSVNHMGAELLFLNMEIELLYWKFWQKMLEDSNPFLMSAIFLLLLEFFKKKSLYKSSYKLWLQTFNTLWGMSVGQLEAELYGNINGKLDSYSKAVHTISA